MKLHWRATLLLGVSITLMPWLSRPACAQAQSQAQEQGESAPPRAPSSRPSILMLSSYVVTAAVQGLDAHSTFKALDAGAVETNPLLTSVAGNRPAFIALKGAIAAALIYEARGLAKKHKVLALLALGAVDGIYIALARHNYRVADVMRARAVK